MQDQQDPPPTPGEIAHACHHQPGPRRGSWCLLELCLCRDSICSLQAAVCSAQTLQLDPKASRRTLTAASVPHLPGRRNLRALTGAGPRIASPSPSPTFLGPIRPSRCFFAAVEVTSPLASSSFGSKAQSWLVKADASSSKEDKVLYGFLGLVGFMGVYRWCV